MKHFRVIADADPSALISILQHLRRCSIAPRCVWALQRGGGFIEIKIELDGLTDKAFEHLVSAVNDMPMVIAAVAFEGDWTHQALITDH